MWEQPSGRVYSCSERAWLVTGDVQREYLCGLTGAHQPDQLRLNRHTRSFVFKLLPCSHVGPLFYASPHLRPARTASLASNPDWYNGTNYQSGGESSLHQHCLDFHVVLITLKKLPLSPFASPLHGRVCTLLHLPVPLLTLFAPLLQTMPTAGSLEASHHPPPPPPPLLPSR